MKKILLGFTLLSSFFMSCGSDCIEDTGNNIQIETTVKPFEKIKVEGAFKLILTQDSSFNLKLQADSGIMKHIKADVGSNELVIKLDGKKYCGTDSILVYAGIGLLKELKADGAVKIVGEGPIYGDNVSFGFAGTTDLVMDLRVRKLETNMDGLGRLKLSGQSGEHDLHAKGNVEVEAFDFVAGIYDLEMDGSAKARINVLNELKVKTAGATEIYYKGNPSKVEEKKSGAAKLEKVN